MNVALDVRTRKIMRRISSRYSAEEIARLFANATFIVSAPRSGSTLLFGLLAQCPDIWTIGAESHAVYAQFPHLVSESEAFESGRLGAEHADPDTCKMLRLLYLALLRDHDQRSFYDTMVSSHFKPPVFLEKTPRNSLNISFLTTIFPEARFIYLYREPCGNISSMIEGWQLGGKTGQFVTFRKLPDWPLDYWCFLLPPGWAQMKGRSFAEIASFQWQACNEIIMDDLSLLPENRWTAISYSELTSDPATHIARLSAFCGGVPGTFAASLRAGSLPLSASTISPPGKEKWRRHETEILQELPRLQSTIDRIAGFHKVIGASA